MASPSTPSAARPKPRSLPRKNAAAAKSVKPHTVTKVTPHDGSAGPDRSDGPDAAAPALALGLSAGPALLEGPTREAMIRARAYERYERNGCLEGHELDDWLAAEAEVRALLAERGEPASALRA